MDRRLQRRYVKLVKAHMAASSRTAAGPVLLPEFGTAGAATQAAWRFFNNDRVSLPALAEPLRQAGRIGCEQSASAFVLLAHDWCKLDYGRHPSKGDTRQLTHQHDVGYDLTTSLLVDAHTGAPLAPMEILVKTADKVHGTSVARRSADDHHLSQLRPIMKASGSWQLPRRLVHVIDREADSLGHFRQWDAAGHLFLVRCDDRRVRWNGESWLLTGIVEHFNRQHLFREVGEVLLEGRPVRQQVAEAPVVLHRSHKTRKNGKQYNISGRHLPVRLVMVRLVDGRGSIVAQWMLLTNVPAELADAAQVAQWYYWRWRLESFFKLLKSHGQEIEYWQQRTGAAITRRLLVAAMACVTVWNLQRQQTPAAEEAKRVLVRLSGRRMKHGVISTATALLAGYFVLLSITDLLQNTDYDLRKIKALAANALPFFDTS
jgi:hypothetical protein